MRFLEEMTASVLSNHRSIPPFGLEGGAPGECGRNTVVRTDGTTETLEAADKTAMHPGDVFIIQTPTGGGFGPPKERAAPVKKAAE